MGGTATRRSGRASAQLGLLLHSVPIVASLVFSSCIAENVFLDEPSGTPPATMLELGLYSFGVVHLRALAYVPEYPLWSSGTTKERFVVLPRDQDVLVEDGIWAFPDDTYFMKTFSWRGERIETRVLWKEAGRWDYAVYLWEGDEASILDLSSPHLVRLEDGGGDFEYEIPSRRQCRTCHEASRHRVLGFRAVQLSPSGALAQLLPPTDTDLGEPDETTSSVLGYLEGNCVHCHNGENEFDLSHEVALQNLLGQPTSASGIRGGLRVAAGDPEASVLFRLLSGEGGETMPPIGVQRIDASAISLFERWIEELDE